MKKLRITVDGRVFDVTVELADEAAPAAPVPRAAAPVAAVPVPVAPPPPATTTSAPGSVCSPLAGKVVSIDVQPGATVTVGAQLVTLEAMKMNTFVYADRAGTITAISAKPGDAVEEGAPLLIIG
jgi:glutaconyl-CoA/methylmalonyl-CoA decarboxylase subunit gamma